jgi:hypothetical protein
MGEPPRDTAVSTRPQQEGMAAEATAVASVSPTLVPTAGDHAVVDVADDDAPPPGWGQWGNQPATAPERMSGVLVMWEDDCVMSQRPVHGAEASSSCAILPAPAAADTHPELRPGRAGAPPAHFNEAQAEQALWQEF